MLVAFASFYRRQPRCSVTLIRSRYRKTLRCVQFLPMANLSSWLNGGLEWADRAHGLKSACLRYFNAAGADHLGRIGEAHNPETHLIPLAIKAALGTGPGLEIFGTDYDTPDGTCVRDYIHVTDLADAHLQVMDRLYAGRSLRYNLGTGDGYSVRQVIEAVANVAGRPVPFTECPRRKGDPAILVASNILIREEVGWVPRFSSLGDIVETAWAWHSQNPHGFEKRQ